MSRRTVMSQCNVGMLFGTVDVVERGEEEERERERKHGADTSWVRWQEAVAQWLPGNNKSEDMARACGEVEESSGATASRNAVCGSGFRCL